MAEQAVEQAALLSQLSPKEARMLFQAIMIEYDQPFSLVQVNRKNNVVEVTIELQRGGRKVIKI